MPRYLQDPDTRQFIEYDPTNPRVNEIIADQQAIVKQTADQRLIEYIIRLDRRTKQSWRVLKSGFRPRNGEAHSWNYRAKLESSDGGIAHIWYDWDHWRKR